MTGEEAHRRVGASFMAKAPSHATHKQIALFEKTNQRAALSGVRDSE